MGKRDLSEEDIKVRYITPAVEQSGWDKKQIRCEYAFTAGRIILRGNITSRSKQKRADYLLFYKPNLPLAIIEAKDNKHPVGAGLQQAIEYAEALDVKFVYASNGDAFVEQDLITGDIRNLSLDEFPSPDELYHRYITEMNFSEMSEKALLAPYYWVPGYKTPRYYQRNAIDRTVNAVACGRDRVLLVCATGTGKTFMAFQIIYRLWKAGIKKKILFLADRNVLVDQTITGDFKPFGGKMTKVENKQLDSSYEIYLALYQQLAGDEGVEPFKQFKPEFFDLILIDEMDKYEETLKDLFVEATLSNPSEVKKLGTTKRSVKRYVEKNVNGSIIDRSFVEIAVAKQYLKMICNTIYKKVDEEDDAGKKKAYKSFHVLAGYLESKGITGIIYPCTRTKKIIGKNLVLFNRYDATPIETSIREIIYDPHG